MELSPCTLKEILYPLCRGLVGWLARSLYFRPPAHSSAYLIHFIGILLYCTSSMYASAVIGKEQSLTVDPTFPTVVGSGAGVANLP